MSAPVAPGVLLATSGALGLAGWVLALAATVAIIVLLLRGVRTRSGPTGGGAVWRGVRRADGLQAVREQAEARVGQPLAALCPLELRAQDRPGERWQGRQLLWLGLGEQTVWFLHDSTLGRVGGVWDALPRYGLHTLATEHRTSHDVEMSWPQLPRLIIGRLGGAATERRRLLGLLAADELGLRAETERRHDG